MYEIVKSAELISFDSESTYRNPPTGLLTGTLPTTPTVSGAALAPEVEKDLTAALEDAEAAKRSILGICMDGS
jgi:hypothetical protein